MNNYELGEFFKSGILQKLINMIDTKFSETFTDQYSELTDYHCRRQDHNSLKNLPPYSTNPVRDGVFKPERKVSTHLLPGIIKLAAGT